jgi:hypothetical protein
MRFRTISVWLSATLDVAESHKINTQSSGSRKLTMISRSLLLLISNALVSRGKEDCKRYANLCTGSAAPPFAQSSSMAMASTDAELALIMAA